MTNKILRYIILFILFPWPCQAGPGGGDDRIPLELLDSIITGTPDHEARFREERRLQLLAQPIRLAGTLRFVAPDRIEKHTAAPREDLVVVGAWASVRLHDRNTDTRFRISDDPVLQALIDTLRAILNGEPRRLAVYYEIEARGSAGAWTLRLKPLGEALADRIQAVEVAGANNWMRRIAVRETTGDVTIIDVTAGPGG